MKKLIAVLLALTLALATLAGCTRQSVWKSSGVLSGEEIAFIEGQYLKSVNATAEQMGFKTLVRKDDLYALEPGDKRTIAGLDLTQRIYYDTNSDEFYHLSFYSENLTDKAKVDEAAKALYEELVKDYGQPEREEYSPKHSLEDWLEYAQVREGFDGQPGLVTGDAGASWVVGDMTDVGMEVLLVEDSYYLITLSYRLQTIVDGRRLTEEELRERVRSVQAK